MQIKNYGGEGGIRTLDTLLTHTRIPIVRLQPLSHLSVTRNRAAPGCAAAKVNLGPCQVQCARFNALGSMHQAQCNETKYGLLLGRAVVRRLNEARLILRRDGSFCLAFGYGNPGIL